MEIDKYSRRKFIQTSSVLASISGILLSATPSIAGGGSAGGLDDQADLLLLTRSLKEKAPMKWVFSGDSITQGAKHTHGERSYPEIFAERVRFELGRSRDMIINSAISGNASKNVLADFDWRIAQFKPQVVSLMLGTNDAAVNRTTTPGQFEKNLELLVDQVRSLNAIPILHTPNIIIAEKAAERSRLPEYVALIQNVASKKNVILIDNWVYWEKMMIEQSGRIHKEWLNDPLHPNGIGHQEIARLLFKKLSIFDPKEPSCGGVYYEGDH
ncbi:SGNH/GDSL hydrolase family protein [Pedobacter heparinus]|uniref:SGNH/GDSL hydrolase family protein n=1 Tax=Pedobacter heparinus TaxID=984 RepID=UPI00292E7480|nr:SGNH/GDSL hydrolase family protein [Pedobacter heparinus]